MGQYSHDLMTIRSILVIGDTSECQTTICNLLISHGYRVSQAASIDEAITVLTTTAIDAVYMDLGCSPQIEYRLLERLKYYLAGVILIIAVDHLPDDSYQSMVFVQRPVMPDTLLRVIHFPLPDQNPPQNEIDWLHEINRNLRLENYALYESITQTSHDWRSALAQISVLLSKLSYPAVGSLNPAQQEITGQIRGVLDHMEEIADGRGLK